MLRALYEISSQYNVNTYNYSLCLNPHLYCTIRKAAFVHMLIGKNLDVHLHGLVNRQSSFLSDFISQNLRIHNLKEEVCNQTVDMSCICANVCKT